MSKPAFREVELDLEVVSRVESADGVVTLTLADPSGAELPEWTPGAHIDLVMTPELVRQYSLCGDTTDRLRWQVGVLLDPNSRGGSEFVHNKLYPGTAIRVRGPRNHFALAGAPRYQFIAGGIGITPMLPMIAAAEATGADWRLLYGGRTRSGMAYLDELQRHGERVEVCPRDEGATFRDSLQTVLSQPDSDTLVYCCGPEGLLTAVEEACRQWPEGSLHLERFSAKEAEATEGELATFDVECQRSGVTLTVPLGKTIYEVAEGAGLDVLGSCMEGVCGTCECDVLEGTPDHRDSVLNEAERTRGDTIMICVSRSKSERLVLDL
ncbi:ferredoxin-NADP reductase [Mycobacterium sp. MAA66]|uniref:PDR/VanB family oxidoreductase n=1 Tax=Mycobacterium sp. MAA66 TaxID=3156297 RepID=UPI003511DB7D